MWLRMVGNARIELRANATLCRGTAGVSRGSMLWPMLASSIGDFTIFATREERVY